MLQKLSYNTDTQNFDIMLPGCFIHPYVIADNIWMETLIFKLRIDIAKLDIFFLNLASFA